MYNEFCESGSKREAHHAPLEDARLQWATAFLGEWYALGFTNCSKMCRVLWEVGEGTPALILADYGLEAFE